MVARKNEKLNQLQRTLPEGLMVDAAWLEDLGVSKSLRAKYLKSGWLERVARGLYQRPPGRLTFARPSDGVEWQRVVISLQDLMGQRIHIGGRSALELTGFSHYLPAAGMREVHLFSQVDPFPTWMNAVRVNTKWVTHLTLRLFGLEEQMVDGRMVRVGPVSSASFTFQHWGHAGWPLKLSTPERAALELVDQLPDRESFEQVDEMFGGLVSLSPRRMQHLLEACRSIKAKRLFMFYAERHNHAWFKKLDRSRIDLGAGKRAIADGGRYDPNYQITVPEFLIKGRDAF